MQNENNRFVKLINSPAAREAAIKRLTSVCRVMNILTALAAVVIVAGHFFGVAIYTSTSSVFHFAVFLGLLISTVSLDADLKRLLLAEYLDDKLKERSEQKN